MSEINNRNYSLDILKFFLAFLIVIHHSPSPFHDFIQPLTTCAVPTFFMISGYLIFYRDVTYEKLYKNGVRIFKLFGWSCLLFFAYYWIRHSEPYIPNIKDMLLLVFVNNEPLSGHLWYLAAYAYALFLIAFLVPPRKIQWFKKIAIFGLALYFICDAYHIYKDIPKYLTLVYCFRNFFFTAIPCICIGAHLKKYEGKISNNVLITLLILLSSLALVEIDYFQINHIADVFYVTLPLAIVLFLLFLQNKVHNKNILSTCGEKYSLYIYIIHPIIIKMLTTEFGKNTYYVGVVAFIISIGVSVIYVQVKNLLMIIIKTR